MSTQSKSHSLIRGLAAAAGVAAGAYAAYAVTTWARYGRPSLPRDPLAADELLDTLIGRYEVGERHAIAVRAPAAVTLATARDMDISSTPLARVIFRGRELLMRSKTPKRAASKGFMADMLALGWGVLAEVPDRELVMGGVTKPWEPNPVFRALAPDEFVTFAEPDYVKIAFTLRADPQGADRSIFRTETRVVATDARARAKFRRYWALLSPGIILIRKALLRPLKREAERRARLLPAASPATSAV